MKANSNKHSLLLILDGVGDRPNSILNSCTPLEAAKLPAFDFLAKHGICGIADPVNPGVIPSTATGTLAIFGYDPLQYSIGRGLIEAMGAGMKMNEGDVALRANWACLDSNGKTIDRRAGRIREKTEELAAALQSIQVSAEVRIKVRVGTEHRLVILLQGENLSDQFTGSDPTDRDPHGFRKKPCPFDENNESAAFTCKVLEQFERKAQEILQSHPVNLQRQVEKKHPANALLTRGPGMYRTLPSFADKHQISKAICLSGEGTIKGIANMVDIDFYRTPEMTANLDTNLGQKFQIALEKLFHYELVILHIKGCDIAAHNQQPERKRDFLEKIDRYLAEFLKKSPDDLRVGVVADHATWSETGYHVDDPVPVLIYSKEQTPDLVNAYDERSVVEGKLGRFRMCEFLEYFYE